jgi:ATP synthase protein I
MAKSGKDLPSLDELQKKIDAAPGRDGNQESESYVANREIGQAMRLGTELLAGVGVGGVIGYFLDKVAGTSPILFILFFFLGFAAGLRNIMRSVSKGE